MRVTLNDIEESRDTQMIQKAKENDSLQNSINEIRLKSRQVLLLIHKDIIFHSITLRNSLLDQLPLSS